MERQSRLKLDLGGEQIELLKVEAQEALTMHYFVKVDILATLGDVDLRPHLGKPATVSLHEDDELQRYFHGMVAEAAFVSEIAGAGYHYQLTLRPQAWFHDRGRSFRIFQTQSARDIIKKTLERCGITFELNIQGGTRVRPYCVQYGESDYTFALRLMEEEGLYYYYDHGESDHTMVICDSTGAHKPLDHAALIYRPSSSTVFNAGSGERGSGGRHFLTSWTEQLSTGAETLVTLRDYNFIKSSEKVEAKNEESHKHAGAEIEVYDYPGGFYDSAVGTEASKFRLEAKRAARVRFTADSQDHALKTGYTFTLNEHPIGRFNARYLLVSTTHTVATEQYQSTFKLADDSGVSVMVIPADTQFRSEGKTEHPVVKGPESARVTGPDSEEIHVDKYGRVKVKFAWDREGKDDDESSCWVRVSQTGGLGNIIIPRVGHEVLVDFINGDPDRPIVVGRVFNDLHMPVYDLPKHKTRALWRTKSYGSTGSLSPAVSLDTGDPGANELRFEDLGGEEEVFVHAQKDMNTRVRNIDTKHVGLDQEIKIGQNRKEEVGSDEEVKISRDRKHEIGTNDTQKVGTKLVIDVGQEIEIKAGSKITLTVGSSKITLEPASLKVATVDLALSGSAQSKLSAPMNNVEAAGVLTAKGAMVKIN